MDKEVVSCYLTFRSKLSADIYYAIDGGQASSGYGSGAPYGQQQGGQGGYVSCFYHQSDFALISLYGDAGWRSSFRRLRRTARRILNAFLNLYDVSYHLVVGLLRLVAYSVLLFDSHSCLSFLRHFALWSLSRLWSPVSGL